MEEMARMHGIRNSAMVKDLVKQAQTGLLGMQPQNGRPPDAGGPPTTSLRGDSAARVSGGVQNVMGGGSR